MKKFLFTAMFPVLLATFMSVNFTSCGSDGSDSGEPIVSEFVTVSPSGDIFFEPAAGSSSVVITASGDWSISEIPDWLSVTPTVGKSGEQVVISVTANATPDERLATLTVASGVATATITVTQYGIILCPDSDHQHAIDLGLSVKWACCNVGAEEPWEYGGYYAWGETEEKSDYSWETYKYCNGTNDTMTKYCTDSKYGTVDGKSVLEPEDDVAHVKWGGKWRMPTYAEIQELLNECTWEWTTINDVSGYKLTASNGNCIFLPAAGFNHSTEVVDKGYLALYWSSSLCGSYGCTAFYLDFDTKYFVNQRYCAHSVRPVCD